MLIINQLELMSLKLNYHIIILNIFLLSVIGLFFSCESQQDEKVKLFAAAGTMVPCNEICNVLGKNHQIQIEKNYAASGSLARQIKAGAEADIYISANKQWIDFLNKNNLIIENSITQIAGNKLVVICPIHKDLELEFSEQFDIKSTTINNISIGDPTYVPVGKYTKQVFDSLNWYQQIQDKIILAKDVTSVLHYVELGECDWGIVYYSEALKSEKVKIAYEIPQELYSPIIFYMALINKKDQSAKTYQFFRSTTAKDIFAENGFSSIEGNNLTY